MPSFRSHDSKREPSSRTSGAQRAPRNHTSSRDKNSSRNHLNWRNQRQSNAARNVSPSRSSSALRDFGTKRASAQRPVTSSSTSPNSSSALRMSSSTNTSRNTKREQGVGVRILLQTLAVVILLVALVPFMGTLRDYNASSSQLVSLQDKAEELSKQKRELDLQIGRWDDNNYVVDQARTRLGFIYPGEVSVRVIGKEKYLSSATTTAKTQNTGKAKSEWYKLWQRSLKRSDRAAHRDQKVSQAVPPAQQEQQEKDQNANQG